MLLLDPQHPRGGAGSGKGDAAGTTAHGAHQRLQRNSSNSSGSARVSANGRSMSEDLPAGACGVWPGKRGGRYEGKKGDVWLKVQTVQFSMSSCACYAMCTPSLHVELCACSKCLCLQSALLA
eukprot:scaffold300140_cov21-Tisochrysis_lutea.AAC.2